MVNKVKSRIYVHPELSVNQKIVVTELKSNAVWHLIQFPIHVRRASCNQWLLNMRTVLILQLQREDKKHLIIILPCVCLTKCTFQSKFHASVAASDCSLWSWANWTYCKSLLLYWVVPDALVCVWTLKYDQLVSFLPRQHVQMSKLIVVPAVTQIRGAKQITRESIIISIYCI